MRSIRHVLLLAAAVLTLMGGQLAARTLHLAPGGSDTDECAHGAVFATFARAVECLAAGDTLLVADGVYYGGVEITVESTRQAPLVIRGQSLDAVIEGSPEGIDAVRIQDCSHVILESLTIREAGRSGLAVRYSDHVRVAGCLFEDNAKWGILTSFADDLLIENNEARGSVIEHGIYHANSGDRYVIRGNHVHHNNGNGIHLNGDPEIPGGDGVLNEGIVERNHVHHNGAAGGAAINMTHVQDIIVRNNLIHDNLAGSITFYQDTGTFEQGSKRALITGNTVYFAPGQGRSGVNIQTTSEKAVITGNIFVSGGRRGNIQVNSEHLPSVLSDYNILWGVDTDSAIERREDIWSLEHWRGESGNDTHSLHADPLFRDIASADFVPAEDSPAVDLAASWTAVRAMVESLGGTGWLLARMDSIVAEDFNGSRRPAGASPDAGAFEVGAGAQSLYDFNGDGLLGAADVLALLLKGLRNSTDQAYDIDGDGVWSVADVCMLVRFLIEPRPFPVSLAGMM